MYRRQWAPYYGLRGGPLNIAIGVVAGFAFLLQGYDQGVMGSLLTLDSWIEQCMRSVIRSRETYADVAVPDIDTVNTHGAIKNRNATIQGTT